MIKKVLIIRFSSIGDIVLTTPVVRCLKKRYPHLSLHYCTKKVYQKILLDNPSIDRVIVLDKCLKDCIQQLQKEKYDLIIDLHHNLRTFLIKRFLGVKSFSFDKLNISKWLYVNFKINFLPNRHIVDRYMQTVMSLGVDNDDQGLDYFIASKDHVSLETFPTAFRTGYVGYAIGGQHFTKRLPQDKIIELCQRVEQPIILLGGPEDMVVGEAVVDYFAQHFPQKPIMHFCGVYNLSQSASLVAQSSFIIAHDTGLMHIAAAFKKKIYVVWGNTHAAWGMYPYQTSFVSIENNQLACRPCSKIGFARCPKKHFKCMRHLVFDTVDFGES